MFKLFRKPKERLNYIRPFHNKTLDVEEAKEEVKKEEIVTEEALNEPNFNMCFQCSELKSSGGVLRCDRNECKYEKNFKAN